MHSLPSKWRSRAIIKLLRAIGRHHTDVMIKTLLLDAAILLGLAILGVIGYKLAPLLDAKTDLTLRLSTCNLGRQACATTLPDGGQVEFSIEPRPIPTLKQLQLQATFSGVEVRGVAVDLAGAEMQMGYNRPQLERQPGGGERFTGQASLPVCITGNMVWNITVIVDTGKTVLALPFRLVTGDRSATDRRPD